MVLLLLLLAGSLLVPTALAQAPEDESGEIYFVFGSDTSTPGIRVDVFNIPFGPSAFDLYASPTGNAARIMNAPFRDQTRDSYGTPLKMTWWMQGGSLYRYADNTNVPLPSTFPLHLMQQYHGDAVKALGDEITFHYHTWVWSDENGDGVYYWNQARSYADARDDFLQTVAEYLVEENVFPVSFRSGWHYMDNLWQADLNRLLPFSLHNDAPHIHDDTVEPIDNLYDWSRAPQDFVPFQPAPDDYQRPGGSRGWNAHSIMVDGVDRADLEAIFDRAASGTDQVVCIWGHLAEASFVDQVGRVAALIGEISAAYPDVLFRYATAVEAMQRWLGTDDHQAPALTVEEVPAAGGVTARITTDEDIFQDVPFVVLKDRYERISILPVEAAGAHMWETAAYDPDLAAKLAVAVTDTVGNLAKQFIQYLPDDTYIDNTDPGYREHVGTWRTASLHSAGQVWGTDFRITTLAPGDTANVRWELPVQRADTYNVFIRVPDMDAPLAPARFSVYSGSVLADSSSAPSGFLPATWHYVGTAYLDPALPAYLDVSAFGSGPEDEVFAADAVKLSALLRDRQLALPAGGLGLGEVIYGDSARFTLTVRNLGSGPLTISGIRSGTGVVSPATTLPFTLGGMENVDLPLYVYSPDKGDVRDTLVIESDDPLQPVARIPFNVRFRDYFAVVDDDDLAGYEETGTWQTSVTQAYGPSSRFAYVSSAPGAHATFSFAVPRAGVYDIAYLIPRSENSAIRARYMVGIDGQVADSVTVNQNEGSGAWRSLGLFHLRAGARSSVDVQAVDRDQPSYVLRADAMRWSYVGPELQSVIIDNEDPTAYMEVGEWRTSVAQAHGSSSRYGVLASRPKASFRMQVVHDGVHGFYELVPASENAVHQARYTILRNGVAVDSTLIDQSAGSGIWRFVGSHYLAAGDTLEIQVSNGGDIDGDFVLRADAVKVVFGEDHLTSTAPEGAVGDFALSPSYPNPSHAATTFTYTVRQSGHVRILLFDVLGRRVASLVNDDQVPGTYTVHFDVSALPSGIYLCRLEASDLTATRKWVVLH